MISFPHCKINLGLDVLRKRPDGYHDIETVMFPVRDLCDSLEIIVPEEEKEATELTESGLRTGCPPQENIVMKAWRLMHETYGIGNVRMHLHKAVPSGAGLGGGSADGAAALRMRAGSRGCPGGGGGGRGPRVPASAPVSAPRRSGLCSSRPRAGTKGGGPAV